MFDKSQPMQTHISTRIVDWALPFRPHPNFPQPISMAHQLNFNGNRRGIKETKML